MKKVYKRVLVEIEDCAVSMLWNSADGLYEDTVGDVFGIRWPL